MAGPERQVGAVLLFDGAEVLAKRVPDPKRKQRDAVPLPLRVSNEKVTCGEVDVLHTEARTLEKPKAGTVEEFRHETRDAAHQRQHPLHFVSREHERHPRRARWTDQPLDPRRVGEQNVAI
jgi:hypothetical protein